MTVEVLAGPADVTVLVQHTLSSLAASPGLPHRPWRTGAGGLASTDQALGSRSAGIGVTGVWPLYTRLLGADVAVLAVGVHQALWATSCGESNTSHISYLMSHISRLIYHISCLISHISVHYEGGTNKHSGNTAKKTTGPSWNYLNYV